ncbi:flagellar basal body P-ring protein FlgI [Vibrio sp. SS-MA-C1-2]|uniref:flagellar basal body P-ring protein FlgI n=1 Tax=Vibrio sp. SS-MA-C1-2 TaxID=2908646 RepID=UPI0038FC6253
MNRLISKNVSIKNSLKLMLSTILVSLSLFLSQLAFAQPIQTLVDIYGDRDNQLIGYGLVVGLDGSGDKSQVKFTQQSVVNMIKQFGVQLEGGTDPKLKNVAAVSVTATLRPNMGPGQRLNITISSLGDAKSLRGGTLLLTPLRGIDGEVYAVAQGNVVVGGFSAQGLDGSSVTKNTPTAGRIPNGAIIERSIDNQDNSQVIRLQLKDPNYKTALNISKSINKTFGPKVAKAINKGQIEVSAPKDREDRVMFLSMIEELNVEVGQKLPRVIFNSRTGTVVISAKVTVSEAAVSQGGLLISITENQQVSQPNSYNFGDGAETVVTDQSQVNINEQESGMMIWPEGTNLQDIVDAVNSVGATPDALMQILQALDEAGALNGELMVI